MVSDDQPAYRANNPFANTLAFTAPRYGIHTPEALAWANALVLERDTFPPSGSASEKFVLRLAEHDGIFANALLVTNAHSETFEKGPPIPQETNLLLRIRKGSAFTKLWF